MTAWGVVSASFAAATAVAKGLLAMPTEERSNSRAANNVVPRPQNGSRTQSPALAFCSTRKGKFKGNMV
jgi:hypothetical protein